MKTLITLLAAFVTITMLAPASQAQTSGATVEANGLTIKGLVIGKRMSFGADFASEYNIAVPLPFSFTIPTDRTKNIKVLPAPGGTGIYKVSFVTQDNGLKSNLQFVPIIIGMGPIDQRLVSLKAILDQAFKASVIDPQKSSVSSLRKIEVGPYPALEAIGKYDGGDDGLVVLRIVAIPDPNSDNGLLAIINALPKNVAMESVEDILNVDGSRALGTMRFE